MGHIVEDSPSSIPSLTTPLVSYQLSPRRCHSLSPRRARSGTQGLTPRARDALCPSGNLPNMLGGGIL